VGEARAAARRTPRGT